MASFWYTKTADKIGKLSGTGANFDLDLDTFKVGLSSTTHVPGKTTDEFLDDTGADDFIDGEPAPASSGYDGGFSGTGRHTLASRNWGISSANVLLDAADDVWTAFNAGTIRQATLHKPNTTNANTSLMVNLDFTGAVTPGGSDFTLNYAATGLGYFAT